MDFIQILLILTQIILINSEKCSNESELCDIDSEKEITLGFYEVPQISHYEEEIGMIISGQILKHNPPFELSNIYGVSDVCRKDSEMFVASLKRIEFWALQMYDASAKVSAGFLHGNVNQLGDFDQCLSVNAPEDKFKGQYCLAFIQPKVPAKLHYLNYLRRLSLAFEAFKSDFDDPSHVVPKKSQINWGVCVPSSCSNKDVELVLLENLKNAVNGTEIDFLVRVEENMCQTKDEKWISNLDLGTKIALAFFAIIFIISIASSFYEVATKDGKQNPWFTAFSMVKNSKDILSMERDRGDMPAPHAIRCFNTLMLIVSHKSMELDFKSFSNQVDLSTTVNNPLTVVVRASYLYTDSFIMLSGMLVAYSFIGRLQRGQTINIIKEIAGRYFRVAPPMIALMIFGTFILPLLGSGPQWNLLITFQSALCKQTWWRSVLMIHNWFGFKNICMTHTHHIGTDFELFLIAPFLICLLFKWPKKGSMLIIGLATLSTFARYYITYVKEVSVYVDFGSSLSKLYEISDLMYIIPPYRFTVYAIGIMLGYCLRKYKNIKLSDFQLNLGWILSSVAIIMTLVLSSAMSTVGYKYDPTHAANYAAFAPIPWCLFFAWIIFTSQTGYKNKFTRAMEWKGFLVFTKLSYGIYLTQFAVFHYNVGTAKSSEQFNAITSIIDVNELIGIILAAGVLTLFIEYPFSNIKKIIFDTKKQSPVTTRKVDENNNEAKTLKKLD